MYLSYGFFTEIKVVLIVSVVIQEVLEPCNRAAVFKRLLDSLHKGTIVFLTPDVFTTLTPSSLLSIG